jgi:hypothetical protein
MNSVTWVKKDPILGFISFYMISKSEKKDRYIFLI